ncbi:unnamed protein product [Xylocopa violacea]|uniref:Uncharacterized protein n=1 Tax=Xylocopa violacea TaxID=135666 RepID=A0ABP1NAL8_XYLVO
MTITPRVREEKWTMAQMMKSGGERASSCRITCMECTIKTQKLRGYRRTTVGDDCSKSTIRRCKSCSMKLKKKRKEKVLLVNRNICLQIHPCPKCSTTNQINLYLTSNCFINYKLVLFGIDSVGIDFYFCKWTSTDRLPASRI